MAVTAPCAGLAGERRALLSSAAGSGLWEHPRGLRQSSLNSPIGPGQDSKMPATSWGQNMDFLFSPEMFLENLSLVLPGQQFHFSSENCGGLMCVCVFVCFSSRLWPWE